MSGRYGRLRPYFGGNPAQIATITQVLSYADFTDDTASGYKDLTQTLPVGALPLGWMINTTTAFSNNATITFADATNVTLVDDGGSGGDSITDSDDGFITAGFTVGDLVTVSGCTTSANNTTYTITAVDAGEMTFSTGDINTAEAGADGMSIVTTVAAAITVGIAGDTDKYSADTARDVSTVGVIGSLALAADAADNCGTAQTVRITATETTDFDDIEAGSFVFTMYYINTL